MVDKKEILTNIIKVIALNGTKILKEERKRADYTDEQFTAEESLDSIQRSKNIQYTLNEIFKKL